MSGQELLARYAPRSPADYRVSARAYRALGIALYVLSMAWTLWKMWPLLSQQASIPPNAYWTRMMVGIGILAATGIVSMLLGFILFVAFHLRGLFRKNAS